MRTIGARASLIALVLVGALCVATPVVAADERADPGAETEGEAEGDAEETPAGPPPGVEVMRVRGRGIGSIVSEVPESVTRFDAATIEALGAQSVADLSRVTPNVNIVERGATQANFYVRGIGLADPSANSAGAVAVFQDGVALSAPAIQTGQLFDVQTVEVLRGPQGTGPYRNASAGALRVLSNRPTGNYGARLRATLGRYAADGGKGADHGLIQEYEGFLEMPLVEEALSTRFAFRLRDTDPYKENGCGNGPPFDQRWQRLTIVQRNRAGLTKEQEDTLMDVCGERWRDILPTIPGSVSLVPPGLPDTVDYEDQWAGRAFLRFQPPDTEMDWLLNVHASQLDQDQAFGQAIGTAAVQAIGSFFGGPTGGGYFEPDLQAELEERCAGAVLCPDPIIEAFEKTLAEGRPLDRKPYRGDYNRDSVTRRDVWGSFLQGEMALGGVDLFVLGSYDTYDRRRNHDTDFTPDILFEVDEEDDAWQTFEQIRLSGELPATPFTWELGGYYLQETLESTNQTYLRSNSPSPSERRVIQRDYTQDTQSFGAWAEFGWDFLSDWTLEGGARLNWERKDFELLYQRRDGNNVLERHAGDQSETWVAPTGKLVLTYHVNRDVSVYLRYGRGFKAGHFNALASVNVDEPPADPEINDAFEGGMNARWLDGRIEGSASVFYYRYQDFQVFLFRDEALSPPVLEIVNAAEAENYGIELAGSVKPLRGWAPRAIEGLELSANFGWLHGEYLDFQLTNSYQLLGENIPVTLDFSGNQLQNSPEFKVSGTAAWTFDLGRWGYLIPRYDFSWTDDVYFDTNEGRGSPNLFGDIRLPEYGAGQPAYWLHDVRLAYRTPTANVEVAVWVRNLTDEVYKTFAFDATSFSGVTLNFVGKPRTIGVDFSVSF